VGVFRGMGLCHGQRYGRGSGPRTNKKFVQILVMQSPGFQDPIVKVHAMGVLFDPQKQLAGLWLVLQDAGGNTKLFAGGYSERHTSLVAAEQ
jgi:hypothetical protein